MKTSKVKCNKLRRKIIQAFVLTDVKIQNLPDTKDKKRKIEKLKKTLYYTCLGELAQELGELKERIKKIESKINQC